MNTRYPFHLSLPVISIDRTHEFYVNFLGCTEGRSAHNWLDVDFWGHQITFQEAPDRVETDKRSYLNGNTPVAHFGAILPLDEWRALATAIEDSYFFFLFAPTLVFEGEVSEQHSFFIEDPSGYAIEFKAFQDHGNIFRTG